MSQVLESWDEDEHDTVNDEAKNEITQPQATAAEGDSACEKEVQEAGSGDEDEDEETEDLLEKSGGVQRSHFSVDRIWALMGNAANIRNMSVIAHVDHGKSTVVDHLVCHAGIIGQAAAGEARYTDTRADEQQRGISIKATSVSLHFEQNESEYLINLVDSPGHVDFSSEVTTALRVTDGALLVVDCVEGVRVQTDTVLRQAIRERIKPVLFLNKLDRVILELQTDSEEAYQTLRNTVENVNATIATHQQASNGMGDLQVTPEHGTVTFGSGLHGWAFSLETFSKMYAAKFGMPVEKFAPRLWGEHYFNSKKKSWGTQPVSADGSPCRRGFCQFILDPITMLTKVALSGDMSKLEKMLSTLGVTLKSEDKELKEKKLLRRVMQLWLPAADTLLQQITTHLPSPAAAQKYRVGVLYEGDMDDLYANAIRNCDPEGPLMMYISKMVPSQDKGRFYAFGRVFSGRVAGGQKVYVLGPTYTPGTKEDIQQKPIQRVNLMMGRFVESLQNAPCGNLVGLVGLDQVIQKTATLTSESSANRLVDMHFAVAPVVQVAVAPKLPRDLPKFVDALKRLSKSDPLVQIETSESGEHIVAGCGELHISVCLRDLRKVYFQAPFTSSKPIVTYQETVTQTSSESCLAKSPNKHNRLYMTAQPLGSELADAIDAGIIRPGKTQQEQSRKLVDEFGWDKEDAKRIWCFGPDHIGTNVFVDKTVGVQNLAELKPHVDAGFQWTTKLGVLCEEPLRATRFNLLDCQLHTDAIHRGGGQIIPTVRRCMYASCLTAEPRLLEPVFRVNISCPPEVGSSIYGILSQRRGEVISEEHGIGVVEIVGHLPVAESFGFTTFLRSQTSGMAFPSCCFDHWQVVDGDPLLTRGPAAALKANVIVKRIRKRKGMKSLDVPPLKDFLDRL